MNVRLLAVLAFALLPFFSHAEVIYESLDHSTDIYESSFFSIMQGAKLGNGLEGELTSMKVWTKMTSDFPPNPAISIAVYCYNDPSYFLHCGETTSSIQSTTRDSQNPLGKETTHTFPPGFIFDPTKYYRYRINRVDGTGLHAFGAATPDICEDDFSIGKCTGTPYLVINAEPLATPPAISNLQQFRQFGVDEVPEGGTFVGNAAVFKADITDADSTQVKLEVELKPIDTPFDGAGTVFSSLASPGALAAENNELIPKDSHYQPGGNVESFHWRARAVDAEGNSSDWVEYPSASNTDFTAKVVPLFSQIESEFPSNEATLDWSEENYASGIDYDCSRTNPLNATIAGCGCAISSLVMIAKYHGLANGVDGLPINPLNINAWLKANNGYIGDNLVSWPKAEEYLGIKIGSEPHAVLAFDRTNYKTTSTTVVNSYLLQQTPVIAFNATVGHYFVMDNTISKSSGSTYTVRDPRWYRTQTLNDSQNLANEVKGYNNTFTHVTIFTRLATPTKIAAHTELYLASPAELLVTDPQGRRAGKDPITNTLHSEIPGSLYYLEDKVSTSDTDLDPSVAHQTKVLSLPALSNGTYAVKVIGTGTGVYTLTSSMTNGTGSTSVETFSASTSPNAATQYDLVVVGGEPQDTYPTPPPPPTVPELFASLKSAIQVSNAKPLVKAALLVQVVAAEKLYQKGKNADAKKILTALEVEIRLLKKKNQISVAHADAILIALAALKARL